MAAIANAGKPAPAPASEDPTAATEAASSLERSVDLCIIMDCTGSMAAWIDACRDTLSAHTGTSDAASMQRHSTPSRTPSKAANAPGDNRLAQAEGLQKIVADTRELVAIVDKAGQDNQRKFDTARQITAAAHGHVLTNAGVWTDDCEWIVYDTRSDAAGATFDGTRIERVEVDTGRIELLYESRNGACCGVVTASPVDDRTVFIVGPEHPTADWQYGPAHRQGAIVWTSKPGVIERLDARNLVPPFTAGALRGGSHVHVYRRIARSMAPPHRSSG
jgi:hypothetical protein